MVSAINVGILQPPGDLTNTPSSGCSSGNCTFSESGSPSFSTIAMRHYCQDITSRIRVLNETRTSDNKSSTGAYLRIDFGNKETFDRSQNPPGIVFSSWVNAKPLDLTTIYFVFRLHWDDTDWKAVNCSLFPVANTYAANISGAVLQEELTDSFPLRGIGGHSKKREMADQDFAALQEELTDNFYFQGTGGHFRRPETADQDFNNIVFTFAHMMVTNHALRGGKRESCEGSNTPGTGLREFMKSSNEPTYVTLEGHTNPTSGWKWRYYPEDCIWTRDILDGQNVTMTFKGGLGGSTHLRVLFEEGNVTYDSIDERFRGLATSISAVMRTNGGSAYTRSLMEIARGTVWVNITCVSIQWPWIAFPTVIIGLTGLSLILVAIENRGIENDRLWKSSFLAALFCEAELHEKPVGKEQMKAVAKSSSMSLEGKNGTLRLIAR
ncbi:hypothetical protein HBH92_129430 [Parastagonospora nodorum]|nr:hypothetical protein HBH92_129430 [Parastagonospora nodorum]KAH4441383.1 hypothetical protein HBH91_171500 [Parastagonospora nodorum]KAH4455520.1 hypothetical protein HBH93_017420 [Parastagonospora nodorum]KAH4539360.1 hypothetical protein HBH85_136330 [Parastagonospora nodorum]KAH4686406.1 hypothetical protein HBH78_108200 [Parastagonospora nodorum]